MTKSIVVAIAAFASLMASSAMAEGLQVNIAYGTKAEKAITKTYGERERETIRDLLESNLTRALGTQAARVDVVVNDVVPNRPTFLPSRSRALV
jgi:hypothetical protein